MNTCWTHSWPVPHASFLWVEQCMGLLWGVRGRSPCAPLQDQSHGGHEDSSVWEAATAMSLSRRLLTGHLPRTPGNSTSTQGALSPRGPLHLTCLTENGPHAEERTQHTLKTGKAASESWNRADQVKIDQPNVLTYVIHTQQLAKEIFDRKRSRREERQKACVWATLTFSVCEPAQEMCLACFNLTAKEL